MNNIKTASNHLCFKMAFFIFPTLILSVFLTGCSSNEDKAYRAFYCGKVASLLGDNERANRSLKNAEKEIDKLSKAYRNQSQITMIMSERFQEDVPLYRYNPRDQHKLLLKIYKSGKCGEQGPPHLSP